MRPVPIGARIPSGLHFVLADRGAFIIE